MDKHDYNLWIINGSLFALGAYLLFRYFPGYDSKAWLIIFLFAALYLAFIRLEVKFPGEPFLMENAIILSCFLSHGFAGLWVVAIGVTLFAIREKASPLDFLYLIGSQVLALWGVGVIFLKVGGQFGKFNLTNQSIPIFIFLLAFLVLYYGAGVIYLSLLNKKRLKPLEIIKQQWLSAVIVLMLGLIATSLYQIKGFWGLLILIIPILGIRHLWEKNNFSEQKYIKTIETFLSVTENKIPHFRGHSERVARFSRLMTRRLRVSREESSIIENAALLHDLGKLGMSENLLRIHSYLTSEEVKQLEQHPEIATRLLQQIKGMDKVALLIKYHHEKFNGEGYPEKIKGEDIPLGSRIIAVADKFDNLINRVGLKYDHAVTELKNLAGIDLDPWLVEIFIAALIEEKPSMAVEVPVMERLNTGTRNIVDQLRFYLDKSWVLSTLQMCYVVKYENGTFKNMDKKVVPETIKNHILACISQKDGIKAGHKEFIVDPESTKIYDAYFIPVQDETCIITIFDLTEVLKTEKARDERERSIYRDVILAVTEGKLILTFEDEIKTFLAEGMLQSEMRISEAQDVARARVVVRTILENLPLPAKRKSQMVLCVSEAATNVIKHVGDGSIAVYLYQDRIRIVIQDKGPGIDITQLPQVTLRKGYSTKLSLGYGFTIMLDYLDSLIVSNNGGTTLVLEMEYLVKTPDSMSETFKGKEVLGDAG